jgi:hypothetical protein
LRESPGVSLLSGSESLVEASGEWKFVQEASETANTRTVQIAQNRRCLTVEWVFTVPQKPDVDYTMSSASF